MLSTATSVTVSINGWASQISNQKKELSKQDKPVNGYHTTRDFVPKNLINNNRNCAHETLQKNPLMSERHTQKLGIL